MSTAPQAVFDLVERFERNFDLYRSPRYNEAQVRSEFIDPFFVALGWDVYNARGISPRYREVIHEASLRARGSVTAPDYCFRVGETRKFFVEAKKPAVSIQTDIQPAYQLRRYAWTAKLPLSILTDFEEFSVYDCRFRPKAGDKASQARVLSLTFDQYPERWDEVASIFSREAVWKGDYDRYAQSTRRKRGTQEVDREFLKEIEGWRLVLARNIALRNPDLTVRELNYAVQKTIDRILFLRISEDRGIEPYEQLKDIANGPESYSRLLDLFRRADERFNSGIFHFREEKGRTESADTLTPTLSVDDKVLRGIINKLYYPDSPYEFSVLSVEILGNVYEQFLGSVIRLTPKHRAVVEQKPEVRKAGGVYYTPKYIVEYIVQQTVGELCKGKTPGEVARLRILDPACGSGSFLLGAYEYLLNYHLDWYVEHQTKRGRKEIYEGRGGDWFLTTEEKKRILLNNVYGVDIDPQAVEVTKLSLLLKVLEGETRDSLGQQLELIRQRALPDLASNVKCGNSLIGEEYFEDQLLPDEEEMRRVNPFDWNAEFTEVVEAGGFDAVIGNPPYVFGRDWKALNIGDDIKQYLGSSYRTSPYQLDMFSIFMEKAFRLCKWGGWVGQIVPNVWLTNMYSSSTRAFVLSHAYALCILTPPPGVFPGLTVDTNVYTFRKAAQPGQSFRVRAMRNSDVIEIATYDTEQYLDGQRPISTTLNRQAADLVFRLKTAFPPLQEFAVITRGVHPYRTGGYGQTAFGNGSQTKRDVAERPYHSKTAKTGYRPFVYGRDLRRLAPVCAHEYVKYGPWLAEPRKPNFFEGERVYSRKILGERLVVTVETSDTVADQQVYITKPTRDVPSAAYLAGILSSTLIAFFVRGYYDEFNDAFPQIKVGQLKALPIPGTVGDDGDDVGRHDRLVALVERMLALHKQLADAKTPTATELLQRQIDATDRQIDGLVYGLYGLTEEEIGIVEEGA